MYAISTGRMHHITQETSFIEKMSSFSIMLALQNTKWGEK